MYELSVASKYLKPRWRQLSVSIISLISILVIALVVWLIVVFFSVTNGLEKNWIQKLTALTAPVRIIPTQDYYQSYYYQIDGISESSNYTLKSISEKLLADSSDPYDPLSDEEIPLTWPKADRQADGSLKDIVKLAYQGIQEQNSPEIAISDYEMTLGNLRIRLIRENEKALTQSFLSQSAYLGSLDEKNSTLSKTILPLSLADLNNLIRMLGIASSNIQEDSPQDVMLPDTKILQKRIRSFFTHTQIDSLKTPYEGWRIPEIILPKEASLKVFVQNKNGKITNIIIPSSEKGLLLPQLYESSGVSLEEGLLKIENHQPFLKLSENEPVKSTFPLLLEGNLKISADLVKDSLEKALFAYEVLFNIQFNVQNQVFKGIVPLGKLELAEATPITSFDSPPKHPPAWLHKISSSAQSIVLSLPSDNENSEGILLPKTFRDAGVLVGDKGFLSYHSPTTSTIQEQRAPVFVAGFYDPGIIPIGGKYILAGKQFTNMIRSSQNQEDLTLSNGINLRFDDLTQADKIKSNLLKSFKQSGISPYWRIETYREFEFTKDILQQLKSDKNLFSLISTVIIIVACSNIISMLIILVNDKKMEIGILRSMGASSLSIATIFGCCGVIMGVVGSLIGILAAIMTLKNIDLLVKFLSHLQGYEAFNPMFYGDALPNEVSFEALIFVVAMTALISLLAGVVPAIKACMLKPSSILRSE